MKRKAYMEVILPDTTDAFEAVKELEGIEGILSVSIVTAQQIRVKYDASKLAPEQITEQVNGRPL